MAKNPARTEFRLVKGSDVQVVNTASQKVSLEYQGYVLDDGGVSATSTEAIQAAAKSQSK